MWFWGAMANHLRTNIMGLQGINYAIYMKREEGYMERTNGWKSIVNVRKASFYGVRDYF